MDILDNIDITEPRLGKEFREGLLAWREDINDVDMISMLGLETEDAVRLAPSGTFTVSKQPFEIIPKQEGFTKVSNDLIKQTILDSKDQPSLFEVLETNPEYKDKCTEHNIDRIGASLSVSSHRALHAVQTLFTDTDYKGNTQDGSLRITISDFLEAYGVNKTLTKRGKHEYNKKERDLAIDALKELQKPILWYVKKLNKENTKKKGKEQWDYLNGISSIIELAFVRTNISNEEGKIIENGKGESKNLNQKITHFLITPSKLFLGNGVYAFIPRGIYKRIKELYRKPSTSLFAFINILVLEARAKRYSIKRHYDTLTKNLNLQYLIQTRQKKKLSEILQENFKRAKELDLLSSYEIGKDFKGDFVMLELNKNAFYQDKRLKDTDKLSLSETSLEEPKEAYIEA